LFLLADGANDLDLDRNPFERYDPDSTNDR